MTIPWAAPWHGARPLADWGGLSPDAWTALGTIALAAITLITLAATIVISQRSDRKLRRERREAQAAEQLAEAYAVQVIGGVTTFIVNHGKYTITEVSARLKLLSGELIVFHSRARFLSAQGLNDKLLGGISLELEGNSASDYSDILAPWDAGVRFAVDPAKTAGSLPGSHPVARWTDRWGNRWQHELGRVMQLKDSDLWPPA